MVLLFEVQFAGMHCLVAAVWDLIDRRWVLDLLSALAQEMTTNAKQVLNIMAEKAFNGILSSGAANEPSVGR